MITTVFVAALTTTAIADSAVRFDLESSLNDRAKWKSFGVKDTTFFNPIEVMRAGRSRVIEAEFRVITGNDKTARLKSLIALAEAGPKGYDAVHHGAKIRPPKPPTQMTIAEIQRWIGNTPRQPHAIGRYQIIPSTLKMLVAKSGISRNTRFTPQVQDQLADILLADAKYPEFRKGQISQTRFMNNLALVWAGLPQSSGRSAYDGYAGNRATISWSQYKREIDKIFG